jgi:hypothetical protein
VVYYHFLLALPNLTAPRGGVSCKRCPIDEVRSVRKLFNCGVYYHFLLALPNLTALKDGVLDPTANKNLTKQNGAVVKTYSVGAHGPAGGWIVYAGDEYDYEYYGFYYIEIAPEDVSKESDGKAIFGSHKYPDIYLWCWWESIELTKYIMGEYEKSKSGDIGLVRQLG